MKQYRDNKAIGAILDEYERAVDELKQEIADVPEPWLVYIVDPFTDDECCRSIQTVLSHVVSAGFNYAVEIYTFLGHQESFRKPVFLDSAEAYSQALTEMFKFTEGLFERYPNIKLEEHDNSKKITVRWNQQYDVEQMMEHAIVHVLRHRRQVERFKLILSNQMLYLTGSFRNTEVR